MSERSTAPPPVEAVPEAPRVKAAPAKLGVQQRVVQRYGLLGVLVLLIVLFSVLLPSTFATGSNFRTIVGSQTVMLALTLGLLLPLSAGEFDLSISANLIFTAAVVTIAINNLHLALGLAIVMSLVLGGAIGLINGFLVVKCGLNGFITTLATMTALSAAALGVTSQASLLVNNQTISSIVTARVFGLPVDVYYVWAIAAVFWYVMERTPLGRHLRVTGSAREAARLLGLPIQRFRIGAYVAAGVMVGFGSVILLGNLGSIDPTSSDQYLLEPYAAAFLGTVAINLGNFNVLGSLIAIYIVIVGYTGLELLGLASWIGSLFQGVVLLAGLLLARFASGRTQSVVGQVT